MEKNGDRKEREKHIEMIEQRDRKEREPLL